MLALAACVAWFASANEVTLVAVGDIMLGRDIERRVERLGPSAPFAKVRSLIDSADLTFGNLECALTDRPVRAQKPIRLPANPRALPGLVQAGFDVLSLANNHSLDCGAAGLEDTAQRLGKAGIRPLRRFEGVIQQCNGSKIGFFGLVDLPNERLDLSGEWLSSLDLIRRECDWLVISVHWGDEGSSAISARQEQVARLLVDHGADLILGHHPHVLQPIRTVTTKPERSALVAYSLGNFVFDAPKGPQRISQILSITLKQGRSVSWSSHPVQLIDGFPRPRTGS